MLKGHLSQKYLSFVKRAQLSSIVPTTPRMNQCCLEKPFSAPVIISARSPDYKRKRIFQNYSSPQSKLTAKFNSLTESTVQPYSLTNTPAEKMPNQIQAFKKKLKTNKENGLNFQKKHTIELKKQIFKKTAHLKSQNHISTNPSFHEDCFNQEQMMVDSNQKVVTLNKDSVSQNNSRLNHLKQKQIRLSYVFDKQYSQQSLIIQNYTPQLLTFNSQKSSLHYSKTNYKQYYMQQSKAAPFPDNTFIRFPIPSYPKNKI